MPLASRHVPQANRVRKVLELLHALLRGAPATPEALSLQVRELRYHEHAARILDLLDEEGGLTPRGRSLEEKNTRESLRVAALGFEESEVARAWLAWSSVEALGELDPASAEAFLNEASELAESTAKRRAMTLSAWWEELSPFFTGAPEESAQLSLLSFDPDPKETRAGPREGAAKIAAEIVEELRGEAPPVRELEALVTRLRALELPESSEPLGAALAAHLGRYADLDREQRRILVGALEALEGGLLQRGEVEPATLAHGLEERLRVHEL